MLFTVSEILDYTKASEMFDYIRDGLVVITGSNHTWVADGGKSIGYILYTTYYGATIDGKDYTTVTEYLDFLLHYNWGKSGEGNGYFLPDVFEPLKGNSYDDIESHDPQNYNQNVTYFGILNKK